MKYISTTYFNYLYFNYYTTLSAPANYRPRQYGPTRNQHALTPYFTTCRLL